MIDYGQPASNQSRLDLPGFSDEGAELMKQARKWRADHHMPEWQHYMKVAREECANGQKASPNFVLQRLRRERHISIPNEFAAPLSRIAMEEDPNLKFRTAASKVDGFTVAKL